MSEIKVTPKLEEDVAALENEVSALKAEVAQLTGKNDSVTFWEKQVLLAADKYARMKIFGVYEEQGSWCHPSGSDVEAIIKLFKDD